MIRSAQISLLLGALLVSPGLAAASPLAFDLLRSTMAALPDSQHGKVLYEKHCSGCHSSGTSGKQSATAPSLAGQREYYLIEQLVQFVALDRNVPRMHAVLLARDLNQPQALRDLAAHLSRTALDPNTREGMNTDLAAGKRIYERECATCHGLDGEGDEDAPIPVVGGQHYEYVLKELTAFTGGHRNAVEPHVINFAASLSPRDVEAVADYISRLNPQRAQRARH